jgi:hypothetical protein
MQHPFQRTQYTKMGRRLTQEGRFSINFYGTRRFNRHNLSGLIMVRFYQTTKN